MNFFKRIYDGLFSKKPTGFKWRHVLVPNQGMVLVTEPWWKKAADWARRVNNLPFLVLFPLLGYSFIKLMTVHGVATWQYAFTHIGLMVFALFFIVFLVKDRPDGDFLKDAYNKLGELLLEEEEEKKE